MNNRGDVFSVMLMDVAESIPHAFVGRDVNVDIDAARGRLLGGLAVEPNNLLEASGEAAHYGIANAAIGATDDDNSVVGAHGFPLTLLRQHAARGLKPLSVRCRTQHV